MEGSQAMYANDRIFLQTFRNDTSIWKSRAYRKKDSGERAGSLKMPTQIAGSFENFPLEEPKTLRILKIPTFCRCHEKTSYVSN